MSVSLIYLWYESGFSVFESSLVSVFNETCLTVLQTWALQIMLQVWHSVETFSVIWRSNIDASDVFWTWNSLIWNNHWGKCIKFVEARRLWKFCPSSETSSKANMRSSCRAPLLHKRRRSLRGNYWNEPLTGYGGSWARPKQRRRQWGKTWSVQRMRYIPQYYFLHDGPCCTKK